MRSPPCYRKDRRRPGRLHKATWGAKPVTSEESAMFSAGAPICSLFSEPFRQVPTLTSRERPRCPSISSVVGRVIEGFRIAHLAARRLGVRSMQPAKESSAGQSQFEAWANRQAGEPRLAVLQLAASQFSQTSVWPKTRPRPAQPSSGAFRAT